MESPGRRLSQATYDSSSENVQIKQELWPFPLRYGCKCPFRTSTYLTTSSQFGAYWSNSHCNIWWIAQTTKSSLGWLFETQVVSFWCTSLPSYFPWTVSFYCIFGWYRGTLWWFVGFVRCHMYLASPLAMWKRLSGYVKISFGTLTHPNAPPALKCARFRYQVAAFRALWNVLTSASAYIGRLQ